MTYKHSIYRETKDFRSLADGAACLSAQRLKLPFIPFVHFFKEDSGGKFERPVRVAGFIDHLSSDADLDIFARAQSAERTASTIFHEACHIALFLSGEAHSLPELIAEQRCDLFALRNAPRGEWREIMVKLQKGYVMPTPAELADMRYSRCSRESAHRLKIERRQRDFEQAKYDVTHFREIQAEKLARQERGIQKFLDSYREDRDRRTAGLLW